MDSFHRLWPYVWPHRTRLVISILIGLFVASLWGSNITVAFPVVKVLLERKSLHDYVDETVAAAVAEETKYSKSVESLEETLVELKAQGVSDQNPRYVETLRDLTRAQDRIADEQRTQYQFSWIQCYVMPFVPRNEFQAFTCLIGLLLVATTIKGVFIFFQEVLVGRVAELAVMGVRKELLHKVLKLDYQSLNAEGASGLMSRFTYDAEQLSQGIILLGGRLVREPLKCVACMGLAFFINWRLTLLSLIFIPLLGLFLNKVGKVLKGASKRMMESMSQIYKVLEETFAGLQVVIGYNNAQHHEKQFEEQYRGYFRKAMKVVRVDAMVKPSLELMGLAAMFVALIPGAYLVLRGKTHIFGLRLAPNVMSPAELSVLYALLLGMLDPCRKLASAFSRLKRCSAAIDRIFLLMDQESLIAEPKKPMPLARHSESIEFRDLSFRYSSRDAKMQRGLVLEHVDLRVEAGEVIAIVGQNGCGKSTLLNLLPRFYDPENGQVLIDGTPISDVSLADLRGQIGMVTQDTILFDDTVFENIRYGSENASRQQVEAAAQQAHLMSIINGLPHGFETVIGDKGKDLSGGQRQRIALARVILRNPSILILDEATSATDAESETLIHETLQEFVQGRTTFVISHTMSQSLLDVVTRIVVMENGKIVGTGTHEQLLETCPLYRRLNSAKSRVTSATTKAA